MVRLPQTSRDPRLSFTAPGRIPGVTPEGERELLLALRRIQADLALLGAKPVVVRMSTADVNALDGQIIVGTANGQNIYLPTGDGDLGVQVVIHTHTSNATVRAPSGSSFTLSAVGHYTFLGDGNQNGGWVASRAP